MSISPFTSEFEFKQAVATAKKAATEYYDGIQLLGMTDAQYDALVERIEATQPVYPEWDAEGLLDTVAGGASAGGDVIHPISMLSLAKVKTQSDVSDFVKRVASLVVVEPKLDGLAVRVVYSKGKLTLVATRGDGSTGENVTAQAKSLNGLPKTLSEKIDIEVRGEVFMTDRDFEVSNHNRVAFGKTAFANPRNATAGALRKVDAEYTNQMSFAAYDALGSSLDELDSYTERMTRIEGLKIQSALSLVPSVAHKAIDAKASKVLSMIDEIGVRRATLGFPIDGAVVKVDSVSKREALGNISHTPRWATAFKYPPDTATTILREIETGIGRTGHMSLTAILEPVVVGGVEISRSTLHNPKFVADRDIRLQDTVFVRRAGDVIPRVDAVDLSKRPSNSTPWKPLAECPNCGEPWDTSSVIWRCVTPACSVASALTYWCSRDAMDIDGAGESVCEALVESGLVNNVADLYDLTEDQLASLPLGFTDAGAVRSLGKANAKKILAGIVKSKSQPFNRVVTGLGIRKTGRTVGRWLASTFKNMDALRSATVTDISEIDKMGEIKAQHVVDGLVALAPVIDRLISHGVTMSVVEEGVSKPLAGRIYVVSGSVPGYTRTTISERIEALGGVASSAVSAKTTALITSETDTSKAKKAAELGIPVIAPAEFAKMIAG
jgi:DNA ligase (NAD+)